MNKSLNNQSLSKNALPLLINLYLCVNKIDYEKYFGHSYRGRG